VTAYVCPLAVAVIESIVIGWLVSLLPMDQVMTWSLFAQ
jgi:hypothetical protein